jgi:hypothetical protein
LKQRKAAQEMKNAVAAEPTSSNTNLNISVLELAALLRPSPAPYPYMQPPLPVPATNTSTSPMLLPPSRAIGLYLTLQDFCTQYDIPDITHNKLVDEGYTNSRVLQYVAIEELKEAGFKNGEIASLKDGVIRWSIPNG